jgi:predicted transcriptional regulator
MKTKTLHLKLPEDVGDQLDHLAEERKTSPEDLALDALRLYLTMAASDLAEELAAWDKLSDEALSTFESEMR